MAAARQPPSQDDILEAALVALTDDDIPPDEAGPGWLDPECAPPAELADLTGPELEELLAAQPAPVAEIGPTGFLPRDGSGGGCGFADGGELDVLGPGAPLAGFADDAHARLAALTDDELIGVLRAWRRQSSWAQARELAAMAELARRRPADGTPGETTQSTCQPGEFTADEIAVALTLTRRAAGTQLDLALALAGRPATAAALEAGRIDLPRTRVIIDGVAFLTGDHAAAVEAAVLPRAPEMTTGQLRAAVTRAVLAADPQAARRRREEAQQHARVECWTDPDGTASLVGRCLPPAEVLAADIRLCQIAAAWKQQGAIAGMDMLRARAYLALLTGLDISVPPTDLLPPYDLLPPAAAPARDGLPGNDPGKTAAAPGKTGTGPGKTGADPGEPGTDHSQTGAAPGGICAHPGHPAPPSGGWPPGLPALDPAGSKLPPLAGSVHLTLPLATLLGRSDAPGEADGFGPLDGWTARDLAQAASAHPRTQWHLTITGPDGRAVGHGSATRRPDSEAGQRWTLTLTAEPIARTRCDHRNQEPGYRPSPRLRHLIEVRSCRCTFPGCRRTARRCDHDHTVPHDDGGRTCECNLAPLCRSHHRLKHSEHWALEQPRPGVMAWQTPSGRRYITLPSQHPT